MGSKLEKAGRDVEQVQELHQKSLEMGQEDAEEMKEIRSILSEIPRDIDSDLLEKIDEVADSSTQEGTDHMASEVHGVLEEGSELAGEVTEESNEQAELSDSAAESFEQVSDTRFGGKGAEGSEQARETAESFRDVSEQARQSVEQTEQEYEQLLSEVQG